MIAEKMQREIESLRKVLSPLGSRLHPLTVPLLDSLENEVERVAGLEGAAFLNFEDRKPVCLGEVEYEQAR